MPLLIFTLRPTDAKARTLKERQTAVALRWDAEQRDFSERFLQRYCWSTVRYRFRASSMRTRKEEFQVQPFPLQQEVSIRM
jgi:hypothetical protein